jgi:Carboxypeptidase regulatory-like domain
LLSASFAIRFKLLLWVVYLLFLSAAYGQKTGCTGLVVDEGGNPIRGATVALLGTVETATTAGDGSFQTSVQAAACDAQISAPGFVTKTIHRDGGTEERLDLGKVALRLEGGATEVVVQASREELAQEQVKTELNQRILGVVPNFMVTYDPKAVPLNAKQKYTLAFKTMVDPETIGVDLGLAALQQKTGSLNGYGAGLNGYAKRFATSYGTGSMDTLLGSAVLPSIFKQDPRYFFKGSGSIPHRAFYAIGMSVLCKGDSGRWQYNYSGLLGGLAAGGISNLYEPRADRHGLGVSLENTGIGIGSSAISNLFQEFLVRKFVRR